MEMILSPILKIFVERLLDLVKEEIVKPVEVEKGLVHLEETILYIKAVLVEAESKKIKEESNGDWLANLREIMYDADDLLDDCRVLAEKKLGSKANTSSKMQSVSSSSRRYVPSYFSSLVSIPFRRDIGKRIQGINSALENLSRIPRLEQKPLILQQADLPDSILTLRNFVTLPILFESEIVGIDDDTKHLVDMLIEGVSQKCKCSIYAITGMAGIGKTTLATKVFIDSRITTNFDIVMRICVSKTYNEVELLKEMVRSITHEENRDAETIDELGFKIHKLVKNKRFFLVLDDIWNEKVWERLLRAPLHGADHGSRVLITTRSNVVAQDIGAVYCYQVNTLSEREGWFMLCKTVFRNEGDEVEIEKFQEIGMEIVRKCKGLPLAIKAVAGVLRRRKKNLTAWKNVCSWALTELPEDIKQGLLLSYDDLPSCLKQCFIYFSLFPEDFTFHRPNLVQMWIAEGFIEENMIRPGLSLEDLGDEYYNELVMRNLLQEVPDYFDKLGCKMHDLFRSLALYVSQNQRIYQDPSSLGCSAMKCRHLSFVKKDVNMVPDIVENYRSLRTLLLSKNPSLTKIPGELFDKLTRLRVLDIGYTGVQLLPDSVGNLIYLRFLSVAFTKIRCLPNSIRKLKNLETLKANGAEYMHLLPKGVTELQKLRHLAVGDAYSQLHCMPLGMGNLKKLRTLTGFVANGGIPHKGSNLKDLRGLFDLTDLSIYKLENVVSLEDLKEAELWGKAQLRYLRLSCSQRTRDHRLKGEEIKRIEEVFEGINPPRTLKKLLIEGFFGHIFPSFVTECSLPELTWLRFQDCRLLKALPPVGRLSELTVLQIWGVASVSKIGPEFFGGPNGFPKLQELYLWEMLELETISMLEQEAMCCLKKLDIEKCPKLKSLPTGLNHVRNLTQLVIEGCENLKTIENLNSITQLELKRNSKLMTISNLPALSFMSIRKCSSLRCVKDVNNLGHVVLSNHNMEALPQWLEKTKLKKLDVHGNHRLISRMCNGGSDWPIIKDILSVEAMSRDGLSYMSYRKENPYTFRSNLTDNVGASSSSINLSSNNSNTDGEE